MVWQYVLVVAVGYLIGSIPTGWIAGKLMRGIDMRDYGSGATGATNVLRTLGVWPFLFVLVADTLKGYVPVLATWYIFEPYVGSEHGPRLTGGGGRGGHHRPRLAAVHWLAWGQGCGCLLRRLRRALLSAEPGPGGAGNSHRPDLPLHVSHVRDHHSCGLGDPRRAGSGGSCVPCAYAIFGVLATVLVLFRHRENIRRLLAGKEPKIGQGRATATRRPPQRAGAIS